MKILSLLLIISLTFVNKLNADQVIPELKVYMEVWAPFQYKDKNNAVEGFAVELLDLILKDLNSNQSKNDFKFIPWARMITYLNEENAIGFSMIKTQERENIYQWIGPIYDITNYVIVKNDSLLNKESFIPQNNITAAGLVEDASLYYLRKLNIKPNNIALVTNTTSPIHMLHKNRVDIIVDNWFNFKEMAQKSDFELSGFKKLISLGNSKIYYAVSKSTDPKVTLKLQKSLDKIKVTEQYSKLLKKYKLNI